MRIPSIILIAIGGYILGRMTTTVLALPNEPITLDEFTVAEIPVVTFDRMQRDHFIGSIEGDVRLIADNQLIIPDGSGAIAIPTEPFLTQFIDVIVPDGMHFVASSKGKYFYPVSSAKGNHLSLSNRIYFKTATEAVAAGFANGY